MRRLALLLFLATPAFAQQLKVYDVQITGAPQKLVADVGDHCAFRIPQLAGQRLRVRFFSALDNGDPAPLSLAPIVQGNCRGYKTTVVYPSWHQGDRLDLEFYFDEQWAGRRLFLVFETAEERPRNAKPYEYEIVTLPADRPDHDEYFVYALELLVRKPPELDAANEPWNPKKATSCSNVVAIKGPYRVERLWRIARWGRALREKLASLSRPQSRGSRRPEPES